MNFARQLHATFAVAALAVLCGCASSGAKVDRDPNVNFGAYKTFGWFQPPPMPAPPSPPGAPPAGAPPPGADPGAPPPSEIATIAAQRSRAEIGAAFLAKGYTETDGAPDFRVNYVVNVFERPRESPFRIGIGAGRSSGNVGGSVGVSVPVGSRTEHVAIMTIDVIDPKRNAQVWTGTYQNKIFNDHLNEDNTKLWVKYILEKFPAQGSK